jgi:DNA-binding LacI/PurR family transcriptional regulator
MTFTDRLAGYAAALGAYQLPFDEALVGRAERDVAGGRAAADQLLARDPRPTAIFAYNDLQALGALQAARGRGLRVPEDLALVGYDDIELAAYFEVPLTTVAQPTYAIGRAATELLLGIVTGRPEPVQRTVVLTPELVVRASSGARLGPRAAVA